MPTLRRTAATLCAVACALLAVGLQESGAADGFTGRGIARISGGDVPGARQSAIEDGQFKAVLDAVFSLLPADTAAAHSSRIMKHFAAKPDQYLQSFKITGENALPDQYQVTVQAAVDLDAVRRELATLGILKAAGDSALALLVMAAETRLDGQGDIYWWSLTADTDPAGFALQEAVENAFADKGVRIISPFVPSLKDAFRPVGLTAAPDTAQVCRLAGPAGVQMVVVARASFARVQSRQVVSVRSVQCDLSAAVIDVSRQEAVAQAAAYGLGEHVDEASACQEAMQRAARQLADQVTDRLFHQLRQARQYEFRLRFSRAVSDADVRDCINAFKQVLPGLELVEIVAGGTPESWTARVTSPAEDAETLKKMFGAGVSGYVTRIISAGGSVLELRVTPIKRR